MTDIDSDDSKKTSGHAGLHRTSMIWLDPNDIKIIGIDTPHKSRAEHPLYDKRINVPLVEADVLNVARFNIITPVKVVKDGDDYVVADGRGRVRRAREVKKRQLAEGVEEKKTIKVPCVPTRGDDVQIYAMSRAANTGRTVDSVLLNAENAQSMIEAGMPEGDVAIAFGIKLNTLKEWLTCLDLAPTVKTAVERGLMSASAAAPLAKLSRAEQETHLEELLAQGAKPSAEKVQTHVRGTRGQAPINTPKARVEKATDILTKFAPDFDSATKDELISVIEKLTKAITGKGMAKLLETKE